MMFQASHLGCLILGICVVIFQSVNSQQPLESLYKSHILDFDYDSGSAKQADIDSGYYVPGVSVPVDIDVRYSRDITKWFFITIPRFRMGSPITLGLITDKSNTDGNMVIKPYPAWSWHRDPEQCKTDRLISVYRIKIDSCGRLWVVDTGKYGNNQTCKPQLLAFDLKTDQIVFRMEISSSFIEPSSILETPVVDVRDSCSDAFVYIADSGAFAILVVDVAKRTIWRVKDKTMYPEPDEGSYSIQGDNFDMMTGIVGMDMEPYAAGRDPKLFYSSMSGQILHWVYTSTLRNHSIFQEPRPFTRPWYFHSFVYRRSSQSSALAIDRNNVSYFGLMSDVAIACWNTKSTEYGRYIARVYQNLQTMQFASGVKIITNLDNFQELWVLTNRFQKFMTNAVNTKEINFRISGAYINDIYKSTGCRQHNTLNDFEFQTKITYG